MNNLDSKINWADFYKKYVKRLKKAESNKMQGLCPFHNDHKASFWFNTVNGCFVISYFDREGAVLCKRNRYGKRMFN